MSTYELDNSFVLIHPTCAPAYKEEEHAQVTKLGKEAIKEKNPTEVCVCLN